MVQSFKFTFLALKNTKGFFVSMVIMPSIIILLLSITLAYSDIPMVAYTGNGANLKNLSGIRTMKLDKNDVDYFLGTNQGTLVIELNNEGVITNYKSSIKNNQLIPMIQSQLNQSDKKTNIKQNKPKVEYSIGFILFKLLTAASLLGTLLVQEKNNGIFVRLKNAKVSITGYIIGKLLAVILVYEVANVIILAFYYFFGFDFGDTGILTTSLIFTITLIISGGIYILIASLITNEGLLWIFSTAILFPLALCSGVLFPIRFMPNWMKVIATISPQYYMQKSIIDGTIMLTPILIMLAVSIAGMIFAIHNFSKKLK